MELHGVHHITAITGDAPANVEFYVGVLGLRMVKKTVNQDDPSVYHLFYADEAGSPGADLTFFEYPGFGRGLPGAGHGAPDRVAGRLRGGARVLGGAAARRGRRPGADRRVAALRRPRGPRARARRLRRRRTRRSIADAPGIPREHALQGFDGVRAYAAEPVRSAPLLGDVLGFQGGQDGALGRRAAPSASGWFAWDPAPPTRPIQGAGSVHHVAFATRMEEHEAWQRRVAESGLARPRR